MARVIGGDGSVLRDVTLDKIFDGAEIPHHAMFRAVHREQANRRAGTASTKKRDEIAGGGRKPWRQKGTGRARQGSIRSPQWRHGGVVFGPQPRSYSEGLNKKERRAAMLAAIADRFRNGAVTLLDASTFAPEKTIDCVRLLFGTRKAQRTGPKTLIVTAGDANAAKIVRAARNIARVAVTDTSALDVKDVLGFDRLVLTTSAYEVIVSKLRGKT
jgi:large subunit ribosomal protein L4